MLLFSLLVNEHSDGKDYELWCIASPFWTPNKEERISNTQTISCTTRAYRRKINSGEPIPAIDMSYCVLHQKLWWWKKKCFSWTGDSFKIKEPPDSQVCIEIHGKVFTLWSKKINIGLQWIWSDPIPNSFFSIPIKFDVQRAHSNIHLFAIGSKFTLVKSKMPAETKYLCYEGQEQKIAVKENWRNKNTKIYLADGGQAWATIYHDLCNWEDIFFISKHTFWLSNKEWVVLWLFSSFLHSMKSIMTRIIPNGIFS